MNNFYRAQNTTLQGKKKLHVIILFPMCKLDSEITQDIGTGKL